MDVHIPAPRINVKVANACREILRKGLPIEQSERALVYIAVQDDCGFNELVPEKTPSMPSSVREFNLMHQKEKDKALQNNPRFFDSGDGGRYYGSILLAKATNNARLEWLKTMLHVFRDDNNVQLMNKVAKRIDEFVYSKDVEYPPTARGNAS